MNIPCTMMKQAVIYGIMIMGWMETSLATTRIGDPNQASWIAAHATYQPAMPVITALRIPLAPGWHTYWINPGEAGMPLRATFELPDGWSAEAPRYPFPMRFKTGALHDFGYVGQVCLPIIIHPPANARGDVTLKGSFSWLKCNPESCLPGDAKLTLDLSQGDRKPTPSHDEIAQAMKRVPVPAPDDWALEVKEHDGFVSLSITMPEKFHADALDVFPETIDVIHPSATFDWKQQGRVGTCNARISPFAKSPIDRLKLAIDHAELKSPITLDWHLER